MNALEFEAYLLDRIPDDLLRNTILNVLTTMEEQLGSGMGLALFCALAHQDDKTQVALDAPRTELVMLKVQDVRVHPEQTFAYLRELTARCKASFAIFATTAMFPMTMFSDTRETARAAGAATEQPVVVLFIQHETMVEDHWYVIARVKVYESTLELADLSFVKCAVPDQRSPVAGLQLLARAGFLN